MAYKQRSLSMNNIPSFDDLGTDELAHILGFLAPNDIMRARLNSKLRDAAKKTIVPMTNFEIRNRKNYIAMVKMTRALPNLQQITIGCLGRRGRNKYSDGEGPDEDRAAKTANWPTNDIEKLSKFTRLRKLNILDAQMNGRYPFLFNFILLQSLDISSCGDLKWDLNMLTGLPSLTELVCSMNRQLTGNINSLRVLKNTLAKVAITYCIRVEGNLMDLADFPHLKYLSLRCTEVTGDIRDIGESDFSALEHVTLPRGVYGGTDCDFHRISDVSDFMNTICYIKRQRPTLLKDWRGSLSVFSPDLYDGNGFSFGDRDSPPLLIEFVQAGSRLGYRWSSVGKNPCEVNWLDPEPDRDSSDYEKYIKEFHELERQVNTYRGFHQVPPTEEEYYRLWEPIWKERGW